MVLHSTSFLCRTLIDPFLTGSNTVTAVYVCVCVCVSFLRTHISSLHCSLLAACTSCVKEMTRTVCVCVCMLKKHPIVYQNIWANAATLVLPECVGASSHPVFLSVEMLARAEGDVGDVFFFAQSLISFFRLFVLPLLDV